MKYNHTTYSLLDGAIKLDPLCKKIVELGQNAVAITDHGWIAGAIKFATAAKENGIKPIIGMETYIATNGDHKSPAKNGGDNFHLTLLARNRTGYLNLMRLTSLAHIEGLSYKPRIDYTLLREHSEGVIVLSGCIGAEIPQTIIDRGLAAGMVLAEKYQEWFGDNFFIEIMSHGATNGIDHVRTDKMTETQLNEALVAIADRLGVGIVATNDAHYLEQQHGEHHDTLLCIGMGAWKTKPDRLKFPGTEHSKYEFFIKDEAEMRSVQQSPWWEEACTNTAHVASLVENDVVQLGLNVMPKFTIPDDQEFEQWLMKRR